MGEHGGDLENNDRVAVLGGGIAASAMAAALLQSARARGRVLDVRLYGSHRDEQASAPAILTPGVPVASDRARLRRSLGVAPGRAARLRGDLGRQDRAAERASERALGRRRVALRRRRPAQGERRVAEAALSQGAKRFERKVDRVELQPAMPGGVGQLRPLKGDLVVRAQGYSERVSAAVLATGASATFGDAFFPGFSPAPTMPAVQARLKYPGLRHREIPLGRLLLSPLPGVDGLYVIPCAHSVYVLAWGPQCQPADLCQALMAAARDGHLAEGFELSDLMTTRVPCGVGRTLVGQGRLAVGGAAFGHPLQIGIADTLSTCARAAVALLEAGTRSPAAHPPLRRRGRGRSARGQPRRGPRAQVAPPLGRSRRRGVRPRPQARWADDPVRRGRARAPVADAALAAQGGPRGGRRGVVRRPVPEPGRAAELGRAARARPLLRRRRRPGVARAAHRLPRGPGRRGGRVRRRARAVLRRRAAGRRPRCSSTWCSTGSTACASPRG